MEELLIATSYIGGILTGSSGVAFYIFYQRKKMEEKMDGLFDIEVDQDE